MRFDPELLIPLIAIMIPIVAILTSHQRKMAEVLNQAPMQSDNSSELAMIREELRNIRETQINQSLAIDDLRGSVASVSNLQNRIQENA